MNALEQAIARELHQGCHSLGIDIENVGRGGTIAIPQSEPLPVRVRRMRHPSQNLAEAPTER
jgi:hypothetical protein